MCVAASVKESCVHVKTLSLALSQALDAAISMCFTACLAWPTSSNFHLEENFQFFCCDNKWQQEVGFSELDYCIPGPVCAFDEKQASNQLPVNGYITNRPS